MKVIYIMRGSVSVPQNVPVCSFLMLHESDPLQILMGTFTPHATTFHQKKNTQ